VPKPADITSRILDQQLREVLVEPVAVSREVPFTVR
jgi:hypothetical protein